MAELIKDERFSWSGGKVLSESSITWGIAEQSNGLMAILLNVPGGVLTGKQLRVISEVVGEEGIVKNSRRMAPVLLVAKEKVADALAQLEEVGLQVACLHGSIRNIVSCPGKGFSKNSRGDTLELAQVLNKEFYGTILPWDFKIGISGCPRNCAGVQCHDVGLMAEPRGKFSLWIGGTESGFSPKHGVLVSKGIHKDKVPAVIRGILELYCEGADEFKAEDAQRVRLYRVLERTGIDRFKQIVHQVLAN